MTLDKKSYLKRLDDVLEHYITAKKHLLFSENYNNKISLGVLNEFRNSYDHLMKSIPDRNEEEIKKSISHLRRAAYDACELISIDAISEIHDKIHRFDLETITSVLPNYYSEIYPRLLAIKEEISEEREKNDDLFTKGKHLHKYEKLYAELIEIDIKLADAIKGMKEYKMKEKKEKNRASRKNIFINILVAVIAALITAFIINNAPILNNDKNGSSPSSVINKE
ncbi:MAG: hypothetical protein ACOCWG_01600 [bacterium]